MFSIGQLVFYGQTGVCEVVNICEKEIVRGQKREYYELKPIYQSASVIFCPTNSEKVNIRPIISYDEAKKLIKIMLRLRAKYFLIESNPEANQVLHNLLLVIFWKYMKKYMLR